MVCPEFGNPRLQRVSSDMKEKTLTKRTAFDGRVLHLEVHDIELEDGSRSIREIIRHPGAVGLVVRHTDGRYLFVRQFRKAVEDYRLEIVAGIREAGEPAMEAAERELREETGYSAPDLTPLGALNASPGYTSEHIELFYAEVTGEPDELMMDPDERVETVALTESDVLERIRSGRILDSKTLAAWLLYEKRMRGERKENRR